LANIEWNEDAIKDLAKLDKQVAQKNSEYEDGIKPAIPPQRLWINPPERRRASSPKADRPQLNTLCCH